MLSVPSVLSFPISGFPRCEGSGNPLLDEDVAPRTLLKVDAQGHGDLHHLRKESQILTDSNLFLQKCLPKLTRREKGRERSRVRARPSLFFNQNMTTANNQVFSERLRKRDKEKGNGMSTSHNLHTRTHMSKNNVVREENKDKAPKW